MGTRKIGIVLLTILVIIFIFFFWTYQQEGNLTSAMSTLSGIANMLSEWFKAISAKGMEIKNTFFG